MASHRDLSASATQVAHQDVNSKSDGSASPDVFVRSLSQTFIGDENNQVSLAGSSKKTERARRRLDFSGVQTELHSSSNKCFYQRYGYVSLGESSRKIASPLSTANIRRKILDDKDVLPLVKDYDLDLHDIVFADYLKSIARGGPSVMTWDEVSLQFPAFFKEFFDRATRHYDRFTSFKTDLEDSEVRLTFRLILDKVEGFNDFPFTWKRFCEIIIEPTRYYGKMISLMRGLQRVINVETTIALHPESVMKREAAELELSKHMESIFFKKPEEGEEESKINLYDYPGLQDYGVDEDVDIGYWDELPDLGSSQDTDDESFWEELVPEADNKPRGRGAQHDAEEISSGWVHPSWKRRFSEVQDVDSDSSPRSERGDYNADYTGDDENTRLPPPSHLRDAHNAAKKGTKRVRFDLSNLLEAEDAVVDVES